MKKFKTTTIILAAIGVGLILLSILISFFGKSNVLPRDNDSCTEEERVFDYADVLTDEEEEKLRDLIWETEPQIGCDIVLVTIDDSSLVADGQGDYFMMHYGDDFYDEKMFGWNEPWGDGALYLDNWGRDENGVAYSWLSTSGRVEDTYSTEMIDNLVDDVCRNVNDDPYDAYATYVKTLKRDMTDEFGLEVPMVYALFAGAVAAIIFMLANLPSKEGQVTTNKQTYVKKEDVKLVNKEDTFLSKNVTHAKISTSSGGGGSSSGGGGGHHVSSGGHSHGGGGGRH